MNDLKIDRAQNAEQGWAVMMAENPKIYFTRGRCTPVIRTDQKTGQAYRYASMRLAALSVGGVTSRISTACMNGKSYKGFLWRKESDAET